MRMPFVLGEEEPLTLTPLTLSPEYRGEGTRGDQTHRHNPALHATRREPAGFPFLRRTNRGIMARGPGDVPAHDCRGKRRGGNLLPLDPSS